MTIAAEQTPQEDELVRRAQEGDDDAFDRLVELFAPRVYNLAFRLIGHAEDAQDLAQEALLRAYDALPRFRRDAAFTTWLYRIVVNVCHDERARRKRRPPTMSELETDDGPAITETLTDGTDTEDLLLQRERSRTLQEAIATLPDPFRLTLVLYDIQGFSYQEAADILDIQIGTVKSRLNRARNLLREKLAAHRELFGMETSQNK